MTTGIFSALSLVSYFIPPDIVPGRMGMLITLFLILINSYNSVDAPPDRGTIIYGSTGCGVFERGIQN